MTNNTEHDFVSPVLLWLLPSDLVCEDFLLLLSLLAAVEVSVVEIVAVGVNAVTVDTAASAVVVVATPIYVVATVVDFAASDVVTTFKYVCASAVGVITAAVVVVASASVVGTATVDCPEIKTCYLNMFVMNLNVKCSECTFLENCMATINQSLINK